MADICFIGTRISGKTTYLAALAAWQKQAINNKKVQVIGIGQDSIELGRLAEDCVLQGLMLEPTRLAANIGDYPVYSFIINIKLSWYASLETVDFCAINYPGEIFFEAIDTTCFSTWHEEFIRDCRCRTGILLLFDGTSHREDELYASKLEQFLTYIYHNNSESKKPRLAFVISKCDLPQLYVGCDNPKKLTDRRFPLMKKTLDNWVAEKGVEVDYFAASAFGTCGINNSEPNSIITHCAQGGTLSVLKDPEQWKSFGLVSPIYWLCTGKRHKVLDKI